MKGIYFSGTGNSKYCLEIFMNLMDSKSTAETCISIEDPELKEKILSEEELVFSYPVQYSNVPKILTDFIKDHSALWNGKRIFIIATMGLFSGDGAGCLGRLLGKYGAAITGGLHLRMPDSICDEKVLKHTTEEEQEIIKAAEQKIMNAVSQIKAGEFPQDGIGICSHLAGLFGQRLYFYSKTKKYTDRIRINENTCTGCGACVKQCPMQNLSVSKEGIAQAGAMCTMCYRCVNLCKTQSITLLGTKVIHQRVPLEFHGLEEQ
ncbi:MAG: 4Fe-4S binding protein [Clostridia bacterium]|nr:4Fe-4S binding protein [Clostridia bacterium]